MFLTAKKHFFNNIKQFILLKFNLFILNLIYCYSCLLKIKHGFNLKIQIKDFKYYDLFSI